MLVEQTLRNAGSTNCATAARIVSNSNKPVPTYPAQGCEHPRRGRSKAKLGKSAKADLWTGWPGLCQAQIADAWMLGHLGRLSHLSRLRALVGPETLLMFAEKRLLIKMLAT